MYGLLHFFGKGGCVFGVGVKKWRGGQPACLCMQSCEEA